MSDPTVSVVIPCYNLGEYLEEAVDSVVAQTFQDFEIVVVDDGLTDERTRTLLSDFRRPKTRVFHTENRGLPAARNFGVRQTTGRYLCMLDADDKLAPAYMERSVAALESEPSIAFVSHWLRTFGDEVRDWTPERCDFPALLDMNTVNGAAMVRRHAFQTVGGFEESLRQGCEDWDFWISLVERGYSGRIIPEVLFHYRRRPDSMSRAMLERVGHPALYAQLVARHSATFTVHLPALVARRDADATELRRQTEDLDLEQYEWTDPELAKLRDDLKWRERQRAREREEARRADELARLQGQVISLNDAASVATQRALAYHAECSRAQDEVDAIRRSLSWRVTQPFRATAGLLAKLFGRGRP